MRLLRPTLQLALFLGLTTVARELPSAPTSVQPPRYSVHDLGTLPGGTWTVASGINNAGVITGAAGTAGIDRDTEGPIHPFLFTHGRPQDLGLLPGHSWGGSGRINDRGQSIGYQYVDYSSRPTPVLYTDGQILKLVDRLGDPNAFPSAINNLGAIVGTIDVPGSNTLTAFVHVNGVLTPLPPLVSGGSSAAVDINDAGAIVGYAETRPGSSSDIHAFLFDNGQITDLGVLPGLERSSASRINRLGHVLGNSHTRTPERARGFLFRDGGIIDIGVLPGDTDCVAIDMNNLDQIVGTSYYNNGGGFVFRAFLRTDDAIWDLQALIHLKPGWVLQAAVGINDQGQILVIGQDNYGPQRTLLLTPRGP